MIEIAPKVSWKEGTITEAVLYCFCLGDGWRLPTFEECLTSLVIMTNKDGYWYDEDINDNWTTETHTIIPVRSIDN
jgi:hypothetical protein